MYFCAMKKENLFHAFEILVREYEKFPMPMHQHTFFELCYVAHGSGAFRSDAGTARFGPGAFILVKPGTEHVYELAEQTLLIYIRFSEDYLKPYFTQPECKALYAAPESKMDDWSDKEKMQLASAAKCILAECMSPFPDETLCQWWANGMIRLCVRRIQPSRAGKEVAATKEKKAMQMMQYVRANLCRPELLRMKNLGEQFNLSGNYIGKYFKACCGESLQAYISHCRLLEAERLLAQTDMTASEIAIQLGFTDESHFSHRFKDSKGMPPREFRKCRH